MGALKDLFDDVRGANLPPCPSYTRPGVRCKKKKRPGYATCGSMSCEAVLHHEDLRDQPEPEKKKKKKKK